MALDTVHGPYALLTGLSIPYYERPKRWRFPHHLKVQQLTVRRSVLFAAAPRDPRT